MPFQPEDFYFDKETPVNAIQHDDQEDDDCFSLSPKVPSESIACDPSIVDVGMHGMIHLLDGETGMNSNFQQGNSLLDDGKAGHEVIELLMKGLPDDFFDVTSGQDDALASMSTNVGMQVHGETIPDAMNSHFHQDSDARPPKPHTYDAYHHQQSSGNVSNSSQLVPSNTFHHVAATAVPLFAAQPWWNVTPVMTAHNANRCPFTLSEMRAAPRLSRNSLFTLPESLLKALGQVDVRVGLFSTMFFKGGQPEATQKKYTVLIPEQRVALRNFSRENTINFGTRNGSHLASVQAVIDLIRKTAKKRDANYWLTINGQLFFLICKFNKNCSDSIPCYKFLHVGCFGQVTPSNNSQQQQQLYPIMTQTGAQYAPTWF